MSDLLGQARFYTKDNAQYPFYLVQLSSSGELELNGEYVSDALVELIQSEDPPFSHVFLQTHGWYVNLSHGCNLSDKILKSGILRQTKLSEYRSLNLWQVCTSPFF